MLQPGIDGSAADTFRDAPESTGIREGQLTLTALLVLLERAADPQGVQQLLLIARDLGHFFTGKWRDVVVQKSAHKLPALARQGVEFLPDLGEPAASGQPLHAH